MMRQKTRVVLILTILASAMSSGEAFAQQRGGYGPWDMGPGMIWGWGMGWFGMVFMIVLLVLMIVGLVFLIKYLIQTTKAEKDVVHGGSRALDFLKERYARGEISKEEFEQMKKDILS